MPTPTPGPNPTQTHRLASALLLAALSAAGIAAEGFQDYGQYGRQHPFVESMQLMMDAMGVNKGGSAGVFNSPWSQFGQMPGGDLLSPMGGGSSQMQQLMGTWPQMGGMDQLSQYGRQWMQTPQNLPFLGSQLNGVWLGRSGEVLTIAGNQFRIQVGRNRAVRGQLRVQGNRLWLQNSQTNRVNEYEFASHEGRLVLRDSYGQLLLYRRVDKQSAQGWN